MVVVLHYTQKHKIPHMGFAHLLVSLSLHSGFASFSKIFVSNMKHPHPPGFSPILLNPNYKNPIFSHCKVEFSQNFKHFSPKQQKPPSGQSSFFSHFSIFHKQNPFPLSHPSFFVCFALSQPSFFGCFAFAVASMPLSHEDKCYLSKERTTNKHASPATPSTTAGAATQTGKTTAKDSRTAPSASAAPQSAAKGAGSTSSPTPPIATPPTPSRALSATPLSKTNPSGTTLT